jgi:hypothetical protein
MIDVVVNEKAFRHYREAFDFSVMPRKWMAWYESMDLKTRDKWFLGRFKCLSSHMFLAGSV